jgi:integrating conjugative element relaxase (TIGR03760 family)
MMLTLFRRKRTVEPASMSVQAPPKGFLQPESAAALLEAPRRQQLLDHIWQRTSLSRAQFASLYRAPLERYAALVQQFPASESHHHAYPGGMLDHGLEIVAYALRLRQSHLLPAGAPPETQAAQADAWTAGIAYGALLHDIGKIAVDLHVEHEDGSRWYPWHGPLQHPYRFRFRPGRAYRLHGAAAGLLYTDILDPPIMDWLSGFPDLWAALLYVLAGRYEHAGVLGDLVTQADQASVAHDLGGNPAKVRTPPKHGLQRKLIDGLRYLVREELKLNQSHASDGWLTLEALWLVSKSICDRLRAHLLAQGTDGVPEQNTTLFNVLQDHGIVLAAPNGKAIWRATVVSDSGWSNSFTFLRLPPALIWEAHERPPAFKGEVHVEEGADSTEATAVASSSINTTPAQPIMAAASTSVAGRTASANVPPPTGTVAVSAGTDSRRTVEDTLVISTEVSLARSTRDNDPPEFTDMPAPAADHRRMGSIDDSPPAKPAEAPGMGFVAWLRDSIASHRLVINDAKALVHTVAGTAFVVSPGVFQRFAQEHPEITQTARREKMAAWESAQKSFEKLRIHKKQPSGLNIWTCEVIGPRRSRRLHGYLLIDAHALFAEVPPDNPYLRLLTPSDKSSSEAA